MPSNFLRHVTPHTTDAPSLAINNVSVSFGAVKALDDVSLRLTRGDQLAVAGPNGAGKSTLFNVIAGIIRPDSGRVDIYGSQPGAHICVGYVPQRNRIDWNFPATVRDVVMMGRVGRMGLLRWPSRSDRRMVEAALQQVEMVDLADRQIGELSGGQQQRVFLARALAQEAELLLMDEPLTGLDLPSQQAILTLLAELRAKGVTILVATHDLSQASEFFPLMALLNRRLIAFGSPQKVLTPANLAAAYGSHVHVVHTEAGDLLLTDTCCDESVVPLQVTVGRPSDNAAPLPEREVRIDGVREK